mgnify:CR=1 FL=1|tara:strand:- start:1463 stop:1654 length:192 start_codon:yes stop_codon:yes gene_type:complete
MTILLNNEKLIFIKGSKVAGSSFELALSKFSQKNDIVTPLNQNEELISATQIREQLRSEGKLN